MCWQWRKISVTKQPSKNFSGPDSQTIMVVRLSTMIGWKKGLKDTLTCRKELSLSLWSFFLLKTIAGWKKTPKGFESFALWFRLNLPGTSDYLNINKLHTLKSSLNSHQHHTWHQRKCTIEERTRIQRDLKEKRLFCTTACANKRLIEKKQFRATLLFYFRFFYTLMSSKVYLYHWSPKIYLLRYSQPFGYKAQSTGKTQQYCTQFYVQCCTVDLGL